MIAQEGGTVNPICIAKRHWFTTSYGGVASKPN